jgi:hypothetical protein
MVERQALKNAKLSIASRLTAFVIIRILFGCLTIGLGYVYKDWSAIGFGGLITVTAFFRPSRCTGSECSVD